MGNVLRISKKYVFQNNHCLKNWVIFTKKLFNNYKTILIITMRYLLFLSLCLFLATACNSGGTSTDNTTVNTNADTDTENVNDVDDNQDNDQEDGEGIVDVIFGPSEYIGDIPVYNTFDEIEYIFHKDTDTTYLINFWATWCKPCVEELPFIEKINKEYADEKVKVLLVSMDFKKLAPSKLIPFIEKNKIESEVVLLADGMTSKWIDRASKHWDGAIPYSIIYNEHERKEMSIVHTYSEIDKVMKDLVTLEKENAIPSQYNQLGGRLDENTESLGSD